MARKRSGLIPVKRMVVRKNKPFIQTVYIRPKHKNKVKDVQVKIPDWNFTTDAEFDSEVKRINKIEDRSERRILKEALLEHVENNMKVKYDKVPETEDKSFMRNTMRAFSAAKKHLKDNPQPKKKIDNENKTGYIITKVPGEDYLMDRDTSKKLARDFRDKVGKDKVIDILKDNGITWNEVPEKGPNFMRAMRALASFIRKGGELGESGEVKEEVKLVIDNPDKPLNESKYEKDSIQYDYEKATPKQKLIALATGVLPVDDKATEFLEKRIEEGQFGFLEKEESYGLPKSFSEAIDDVVELYNRPRGYDINFVGTLSKYNQYYFNINDDVFEGTEYEDAYKVVKETVRNFDDKWKGKNYNDPAPSLSDGMEKLEESIRFVEKLNEIDTDWQISPSNNLNSKFVRLIEDVLDKSDDEIDEFWDEFGMDRFIQGKECIFGDILSLITHNSIIFNRNVAAELTGDRKIEKIKEEFDNGNLTKKDIIKGFRDNLDSVAIDLYLRNGSVSEAFDNSGLYFKYGFLGGVIRDAKNRGSATFDENEFIKNCKEAIADMAPLYTPEAEHIIVNMKLHKKLRDISYRVKVPDYEILPRNVWEDPSRSIESKLKIHVGALRKKTDKARENYLKKYDGTNSVNYAEAMKIKADPEKIKFPSADKIKGTVKSTLMTVPDEEADTVTKKIQETHDNINHKDFTTKVHGVYRVKRIASEEKFQKINDDINNSGFFYHGTSFDTSQKILGESGGFKVFKSKDKIKTGSMLGHGIYLASNSSKSMQYVGSGFRSGARGVLFLCKASLGNVKESNVKGASYNDKLMEEAGTDTVYMGRPLVLNPEWAVKRGEQAVPRLLIDAERVRK